MSEEDRTKLHEKITKSRADYKNAIDAIQQNLHTLGGPQPPQPSIPVPSIGELTRIREIAVKEKAKLTAKSLDALIEKQRNQQQKRAGREDINIPRKPTKEGGSKQ